MTSGTVGRVVASGLDTTSATGTDRNIESRRLLISSCTNVREEKDEPLWRKGTGKQTSRG